MRVELLSKERADREREEHAIYILDLIVEVKGSAIVVIWEAKIKLAEDMDNTGS